MTVCLEEPERVISPRSKALLKTLPDSPISSLVLAKQGQAGSLPQRSQRGPPTHQRGSGAEEPCCKGGRGKHLCEEMARGTEGWEPGPSASSQKVFVSPGELCRGVLWGCVLHNEGHIF